MFKNILNLEESSGGFSATVVGSLVEDSDVEEGAVEAGEASEGHEVADAMIE